MSTNFVDKEFGDIKVIKRNKLRYIKITVQPFEGVKVVIPDTMSSQNMYRFIQSKKKWISTKLQEIKKIENRYTVFKEKTVFKTKNHTLLLQKANINVIKIIIKNGIINVIYPIHADILDNKIQNAIRKAVEEAWRIEAKKYLPERVSQLAEKFHFKYNKVFIKNLKSIWGSCSSKNNINLNLHLMRLPQHLTDYIILHELCHTIHKNHGPGFKNLLERISGNSKLYEKEMKNFLTNIW